jgi:hypothetical protein
MDGFITLVIDLIRANGLRHAGIHRQRRVVTRPGDFRPTKLWDLRVINEGRLMPPSSSRARSGRPSETTSIIGLDFLVPAGWRSADGFKKCRRKNRPHVAGVKPDARKRHGTAP